MVRLVFQSTTTNFHSLGLDIVGHLLALDATNGPCTILQDSNTAAHIVVRALQLVLDAWRPARAVTQGRFCLGLWSN